MISETEKKYSFFTFGLSLFILIFPWIGIPYYPYIIVFLFLPLITSNIFLIKGRSNLFVFFIVIIFTLFIMISNSSITALLYTSIIIVLLYALSNREIIQSDSYNDGFKYLLIISFCIISLTWRETSHAGRFGTFVGEPNFSALWCLALLFSAYSFENSKKFRLLTIILICLTIVLTQSRMALITFIIFLILRNIKSKRTLKFLGFVIIFISMFGQLIANYIFEIFLELQNVGSNDLISRMGNFKDSSNLRRIYLFNYTLDLINSDYLNLFFGVPKFEKLTENNPAHNWFISMVGYFGIFYTFIFSYLLFKINSKFCMSRFNPVFASVIFMAGILTISAVLAPLLLVLLFILNEKHDLNFKDV